MPDSSYATVSTSRQSATVEARVLSETTTTRRVILPMIVENPGNPEAGVKITIIHQRKTSSGEWEDMESVRLSTLHAGETVKMPLDSAETLVLHRELEQLYTISEGAGVLPGRRNLIVAPQETVVLTDPQKAEAIRSMIESGYSQDIWDQLVAQDPDLVTRLSYARMHAERAIVLAEFEASLAMQKPESYWQDFFERHTWIFGYGLNYQILRLVEGQPYYGGRRVDGAGSQQGDFLCRTDALAKFTVLVEIKKPQTPLFGSEHYRNGAWELNSELTGGITQVQANCRTWDNDGSQEEQTHERLLREGTYTVEPEGILVIGHSSQYATDTEKRNTFESFRRNLHGPKIVTFDELFARAKFIVEQPVTIERPRSDEPVPTTASTVSVDDLPF